MASSAKYQPAPTSDPDDHVSYTQAPPAYQPSSSTPSGIFTPASTSAPPPSAADDILYGAAPRTSDDNVPDDFKFGGTIAEATPEIRHLFIRKVYLILTLQLLLTTLISSLTYLSTSYKTFIQTHPVLVWLSLLFSLLFLALTYWKRHSYPQNLLFLTIFTAFEAYTISVIVSLYDTTIVLNAVLLTAGIFVGLTLFACQSKYDFTSWAPYLFGALWGVVLFGFMAMFLPYSSTGELVYGGLAALVFSGYILVDTQMIMRHHHVEEEIAAAVSLYLDVINLFLAILRILNSQSSN